MRRFIKGDAGGCQGRKQRALSSTPCKAHPLDSDLGHPNAKASDRVDMPREGLLRAEYRSAVNSMQRFVVCSALCSLW